MKKGSLVFASSEQCADLWYLTGFRAGDPFLWFEVDGQSYLIANPLEKERARKQALPEIRVIGSNELYEFCGCSGETPRNLPVADSIQLITKCLNVDIWRVPYNFPAGLDNELRKREIQTEINAVFCPQRDVKSPREIELLRHSQRMAEAGLNRAVTVLGEASIADDGTLMWNGSPLLAEQLRGEIDTEIARLGGCALGTIAAPGVQGADPHQAGSGKIRAHEPIVMDIFPRCGDTGYFGDLTRTVVKGTASDEVRKVYGIVHESQKLALGMLRAGVTGKSIHCAVCDFFDSKGYPTRMTGIPCGFFHGLGHGVGMEIHEEPRLNMSGDAPLVPGNVVTVEPGLYYPEWGGVRLENLVAVTQDGFDDLTVAGYCLEID